MDSRARVNAALVVSAIVVGFGITFGILRLAGWHPGTSDPSGKPSSIRSQTQKAGDGPSPNALDSEWLDYSDHSTCADWAGGDGVSAIRLSPSQIAWFYADTYLGPAGPTIGYSHLGGFLHNSVVMQTTAHRRTSFVTLTGGHACPGPTNFGNARSVLQAASTSQGQERYWDGDGMKVGNSVVKFYNLYEPGPFPFTALGTTIARFGVSKLSAAGHGPRFGAVIRPKLTTLPSYTPPGGGTPIIWGSALLTQPGQSGAAGQTVYVYGWQSPDTSSPTRQLYLARVSVSRLADFGAWQFFSSGRWVDSQSQAMPIEPLLGSLNVPSGFSVVQENGQYWLIQAPGAGDPDILAYPAPAPWGPFDNFHPIVVYRVPGIGLNIADDYRVMYEARAEPALSTSQTLVISYNVNSEAINAGCTSLAFFTNEISQPRFIAVPEAAFSSGADPQHLVRAGATGYPQITMRNPSEWYDQWSYPGGCPPVPAVSGITARTSRGTARLTWPSPGIGLQYQVYLSGSANPGPVRTVSSPQVTLTGLRSGVTYQVQVVPVNYYSATGPGAEITVRIP
jgi:hypothetical protein